MPVSRRRLMQSLVLTGAGSSGMEAADPAIELDALRIVSAAHGTRLSDDRLRVVKPVLEQRLPQLRTFRDLEIDDAVAPAHGCL